MTGALSSEPQVASTTKGMSGMGVDNGGAAMNTSVPHLDLFELLDLYDDIIMANNKSMASEDDYQLCPNATQVITDNSSGIVDVECMYPTGLDSNASVWRNSTRTRERGAGVEECKECRIVYFAVVILLTILGNGSVVMSILVRRYRTKVTRMYFFILHLSIADILTAFFTLLPEMIWTVTWPHFYGGSAVCKAVKFAQVLAPYLSSYTLVMTAVDRYQAICFPLSNYKWTLHRSHIMLAVAWILSLLFSIPNSFIYFVHRGTCTPNWGVTWGAKAYVTWFAVSNFFVPFAVLLFCYSNMCVALYTNFKQKDKSQQGSSGDNAGSNVNATLHTQVAEEMTSVFVEENGETSVAAVEDTPEKKRRLHGLLASAGHRIPSRKNRDKKKRAREKNQIVVDESIALPDPQTLLLDQQKEEASVVSEATVEIAPAATETSMLATNRGGGKSKLKPSMSMLAAVPATLSSVSSEGITGNTSTTDSSSAISRSHSCRQNQNNLRLQLLQRQQQSRSTPRRDSGNSSYMVPASPTPSRQRSWRVTRERTTSDKCPRSHSIRTISNAKIKTVKLTVVVVLGHLFCSVPYVFIQLYTVWGNPDMNMMASFSWLFWLFTLNSCLNPFIYMAFNRELVHTLVAGVSSCCCPSCNAPTRTARRPPAPSSGGRTRSRFGGGFELKIGSGERRRPPTNGNGTSRERRSQVPCSIVVNTEFGGGDAASIDDHQVGKKAGSSTFTTATANGNQLSGRGIGRRKSGASAKNASAHFKSTDQTTSIHTDQIEVVNGGIDAAAAV